jgi:hypothetical protein
MFTRVYKVIWTGTYSAAIDIAEINNASGKVAGLISVNVTQTSEEGDAEDEMVAIEFIRAHATSGSGGSAFTALPEQGDAAFSGTCEIGNTTLASTGTPVTHLGEGFNVRAGYSFRPHEVEMGQYLIASGERAVIRLPDTPTDAITIRAVVLFGEIG